MSRGRPQVHLQSLEADDALRLVGTLQAVIDAIWRAHGEAMNERMLERYFAEHRDAGDLVRGLDDSENLPF